MEDGVGPLIPWAAELEEFLRGALPTLRPVPYSLPLGSAWYKWVPVPALRCTHSGIDSRMIFAHDEREGRSVYETTDGLWRGT